MADTGYVRQSSGNIVTGHIIQASDLNAEFNQLQSAFDASVGHMHDGGAGAGQPLNTGSLQGMTGSSSGFIRAGGTGTFTASPLVTADIANGTITYPLIQNGVATGLLSTNIGAAPSEITLGATLTFNTAVLQTIAHTGDVTSSANSFVTTLAKIQGTVVSGTTGSTNVVFSGSPTITSPTLVTPVLGVATATTINKVTITAPATGSTLTIGDGKTEVFNSSWTFSGADSIVQSGGGGTLTFQGTDTYIGRATTDTLTNKTLTTPTINGGTIASPTITTPTITVLDNAFTIQNNADNTKQLVFGTSLQPTGTTTTLTTSNAGNVTVTLPAASTTIVGRSTVDTLTNKTLTSPAINTATITGGTVSATTLGVTASAGDSTTALATTAFINSAGIPIRKVKRQVFTSGGTYTPSTGMVFCNIRLVGAGGGSGGTTTTNGTQGSSSGGGGGGEYAEGVFTAATIGATQTITIGAGGTAGAVNGGTGGSGGTTSVGSVITAIGGSGGGGSGVANSPAFTFTAGGGTGGSGGSGGDFRLPGGVGGSGFVINIQSSAGCLSLSGQGGSSVLAGMSGVIGISTQSIPITATGLNYGAGAAGVSGTFLVLQQVGSVGAPGIVIITEYCSQ